jgi:ribosomal protein L28
MKFTQSLLGVRHVLYTHPTPPSWYSKHCLMHGTYDIIPKHPKEHIHQPTTIPTQPYTITTSNPPAHLCNPHKKHLWSNLLQGKVKVRVTSEAMLLIDQMGGLDEYILHSDWVDGSCGAVLKKVLLSRLTKKHMVFTATD